MLEAIAIVLLGTLGLLVELEHRKAQRRRRNDQALSAALEYLAHLGAADVELSRESRERLREDSSRP